MTAVSSVSETSTTRAVRAVQLGLLANVALVAIKLTAGIVGNTYALVADAAESMTDIISSLIVWGGLRLAEKPPDIDHPFGHGRAEALAATVVSVTLLGAAIGIAVLAVQEIRTPHHVPAPFTLAVAGGVIITKGLLARRVRRVGTTVSSTAVKADAFHHMSDAISSFAAFIGIGIALAGSKYLGGSGWESADDWAALVASVVVFANGIHLLRPAVQELMDRSPSAAILGPIAAAATTTPGVSAIESLKVRKAGLGYLVELHVQANPELSLRAAHVLSGRVKNAIRTALPDVQTVLVHMEPFEEMPPER
ncbi:MAG: cation diffusion facilitator family transporter [Gemmatimonadetes bacterium]|nr:cation diffusion facilitator family transporter [Gemmatimonadota bacterium]